MPKPGKHPNSLKNLRPFGPDNPPTGKGPKPSKLKKFIEGSNLSATDINIAIKALMDMDENEIQALADNIEEPLTMRIMARAMLEDFKNNQLTRAQSVIERVAGKPVQPHELSADIHITFDRDDAEL